MLIRKLLSEENKIRLFLRRTHTALINVRIRFIRSILNKIGIKKIGDHWLLATNIDSNSNVIDLGANVGGFSGTMKTVFGCKCFAVEPNKNLHFHFINKDIKVFDYAIGSIDGPISFYISSNPEASSIISDFENVWGTEEKVTVEGLTFASLIKKLDLDKQFIEILKIDIEGAELDLIESLNDNDILNVKQITIEFHDWINSDLHERTVASIKKLKSFGFNLFSDTPHHRNAVEMLFVNKNLVQFNFKQKVFSRIYKLITFLKY